MSVIKGTNQIVAGFGGTKRSIGEVYFSQSSLATDNSGALPLFTGETIASANTIYPDFYNWVLAHTELQCTSAEYESALSTYGECPKYVLGGTTTNVTQINFSRLGYPIYTKKPNIIQYEEGPYAKEQAYSDENLTNALVNVEVVWQLQSSNSYTVYIIPNQTTGTAQTEIITDSNFENTAINYNYNSFTISDGSLRLPLLKNYIKAANTAEGITQKEAGLPNITGTTSDSGDGNNNQARVTGAFFVKATSIKSNKDDQWRGLEIGFDASRSSAVYGKSDTVTPPSTTLYPWVAAYTAAIPTSEAQAAEFQQGLSGKADTSLSNVSVVGKETVVGWGMSDYTAGVSLTDNSTYTPPVDGEVHCNYAGSWAYAAVYKGTSDSGVLLARNRASSGDGGGFASVIVSLNKGETYYVMGKNITFYPYKGEI